MGDFLQSIVVLRTMASRGFARPMTLGGRRNGAPAPPALLWRACMKEAALYALIALASLTLCGVGLWLHRALAAQPLCAPYPC